MASALRFLKSAQRTPKLFQPSCGSAHQHNSKRFLTDSLKKKFELFQRDDGIPVHLKGGLFDKILLVTTTVLSVAGVADGIYSMLQMAFPKKNS